MDASRFVRMRPSQFIDPPLQDIAEWFKDVDTKFFSFTLSFFLGFFLHHRIKEKENDTPQTSIQLW